MKTPSELYTIQEPAESNVFKLDTIRSYEHGLVTPRPIGAPWPRQVDWSTFLQKNGV